MPLTPLPTQVVTPKNYDLKEAVWEDRRDDHKEQFYPFPPMNGINVYNIQMNPNQRYFVNERTAYIITS